MNQNYISLDILLYGVSLTETNYLSWGKICQTPFGIYGVKLFLNRKLDIFEKKKKIFCGNLFENIGHSTQNVIMLLYKLQTYPLKVFFKVPQGGYLYAVGMLNFSYFSFKLHFVTVSSIEVFQSLKVFKSASCYCMYVEHLLRFA